MKDDGVWGGPQTSCSPQSLQSLTSLTVAVGGGKRQERFTTSTYLERQQGGMGWRGLEHSGGVSGKKHVTKACWTDTTRVQAGVSVAGGGAAAATLQEHLHQRRHAPAHQENLHQHR